MQAAYFERLGSPDVIQFGEQPDPKPARWQVVVGVKAASVNPVDYKIIEGEGLKLFGGKFPRIPGSDFAGVVLEIGASVTRFKKGDKVYGITTSFLGGPGSHAEKTVTYTKVLRHIPEGQTFETMGSMGVGALTALNGYTLSGDAKGKRVLIAGASGGVGHFALQLGKYFDAHVTTLCSKKNIEFVKALGADLALDYKETDLNTYTEKFDLFYDAFGSVPYATASRLLVNGGKYVTTTPRGLIIARALVPFIFSGPRVIMANLSTRKSGFELIEKLLVEKKLKAVIAAKFPLPQTREAYQSLKAGGHAGKVLITVDN